MMVIKGPNGKPERGGDDSTGGPDGLGDFGSSVSGAPVDEYDT